MNNLSSKIFSTRSDSLRALFNTKKKSTFSEVVRDASSHPLHRRAQILNAMLVSEVENAYSSLQEAENLLSKMTDIAENVPFFRGVKRKIIAQDITVSVSHDTIIRILESRRFKRLLHQVYSPLEMPSKMTSSNGKEETALLLALRTKRGQAALGKILESNSGRASASLSDDDVVYLTETVNEILHESGFRLFAIGNAVNEEGSGLFHHQDVAHRWHFRHTSTIRDAPLSVDSTHYKDQRLHGEMFYQAHLGEHLDKLSVRSKNVHDDGDAVTRVNKHYFSSKQLHYQVRLNLKLSPLIHTSNVTVHVEKQKQEDTLKSTADLTDTMQAVELVNECHGKEVSVLQQIFQNNDLVGHTTGTHAFSSVADPHTPSLSPQESSDNLAPDIDAHVEDIQQQSPDSGHSSVSHSEHGQSTDSNSLVSPNSPSDSPPDSRPSSPASEQSLALSLQYDKPVEETGLHSRFDQDQPVPSPNDQTSSQPPPSTTTSPEDQGSGDSMEPATYSDGVPHANIQEIENQGGEDSHSHSQRPRSQGTVSEHNTQQSLHDANLNSEDSTSFTMSKYKKSFTKIEEKPEIIHIFPSVAGPRSPSSGPENSLSYSSAFNNYHVEHPVHQQHSSDSGNPSHSSSQDSRCNQSFRAYSETLDPSSSPRSNSPSTSPRPTALAEEESREPGTTHEIQESRPSPNDRSSSPVLPNVSSRSPSPDQLDSDISSHSSDNEWSDNEHFHAAVAAQECASGVFVPGSWW